MHSYLAAGHCSLDHVVCLALLPSHLLYPFGRVWVDLWDLDLRLFAGLFRHDFILSPWDGLLERSLTYWVL